MLASGLIAMTSCSLNTQATVNNYLWPCLTDSEAGLVLPVFETAVETSIGPDSSSAYDTTLIEKTCRRRVYQRNGQQFEIVKSWRHLTGGSIAAGHARTPEESMACLNQAVEDIRQLHYADADAIEKTYRERLPERWNSLDQGPASGLDCSQGKGGEYYNSIDTALHEMTHSLRSNDCVFVPNVTGNRCFDFKHRGSMPRATVVLITNLPTKDPEQLRFLAAIQKIYQYMWAQSTDFPLGMFDELNAYTITTETMTAVLSARGVAALTDADHKRSFVSLPIFMIYTLKYLVAVKEEYPKLYNENFAEGTNNRKVIDLLLGRAEKAYVGWTDELQRVGKPELELENNLWRQYLLLKPQVAAVPTI